MTPAICHIYGQLDQAQDRCADELDILDHLGIPADLSVRCRPSAALIPRLRSWSAAGGLIAPSLYPSDLDPAYPNANWWAYDADTCTRLLRIAQDSWRDQGLGELEALTTYTPGNGLIEACRRVGIGYVLGFCAPTVINDGHWQITHAGAPLGPFLASNEDYRKPGQHDHPVVVSSMELRNPMTCLEHWSEGPFCPLNLIMGDRTIETGEYPLETMAACEDWIRLSELTGTPRWFHINLQWFTSPRCFDLNRRCLEWLHRQERMGRIRFATLRTHRAALLAAGGVLPQTTWWRGSCMGQTIGGQPAGGVECIVQESPAGQRQFRRGDAGPRRVYDYRKRWTCAPFDPLGQDPAYTSSTATITNLTHEGGADNQVVVRFHWSGSTAGPLCVWEACRDLRAPFTLVDAGGLAIEIVPHPGGVGGAIVFDAPAATGQACITLRHAGAAEDRLTRHWAGLVTAETVVIDDRPITRLAPNVPTRLRLPLATTCRHHVRWESIGGGTVRSGLLHPGEQIEVELDGSRGASVVHLWDTESADLVEPTVALAAERMRLLQEAQATAHDLAPTAAPPDAPLTCGSEDQTPSWAVMAAVTAADREIAIVNAVAERLAGRNHEAAIHCASDLPYGTKGRVRSQRYDRHERRGAAFFRAIYYDYGQSHGPGICGWNQFWQVNLGLHGLTPGQPYRLILHLYDPEQRGGAVRFLGRRCDAHGQAGADSAWFDLRGQRSLAQGVQARYTPAAFAVLDLPSGLTADGSVDIAVRSQSEMVRYDRLREGYGYVFLAHAWVYPR